MTKEELQKRYLALSKRLNEALKDNEAQIRKINLLQKEIAELEQEAKRAVEAAQSKAKSKSKKIMEEVIVINDATE